MSTNATLSDSQWFEILAFLRAHPRVYVGKEANCRQFVEAVLWITRTGAQWRFLPREHGRWNSVYKRFARWCEHGVWEAMHLHFIDEPDMENLIIDSTIVRAHPCAAGAPQKTVAKPAKLWAAAGWILHQNPCKCGRIRQSFALPLDRWSTA